MSFAGVRSAIFAAAGGFCITDFYLASSTIAPPKPKASMWSNFGFGDRRQQQPPTSGPWGQQSIRCDIENFVSEHQPAAMAVTSFAIFCGGPWSMLGGAVALFSDTKEGVELYTSLREALGDPEFD